MGGMTTISNKYSEEYQKVLIQHDPVLVELQALQELHTKYLTSEMLFTTPPTVGPYDHLFPEMARKQKIQRELADLDAKYTLLKELEGKLLKVYHQLYSLGSKVQAEAERIGCKRDAIVKELYGTSE